MTATFDIASNINIPTIGHINEIDIPVIDYLKQYLIIDLVKIITEYSEYPYWYHINNLVSYSLYSVKYLHRITDINPDKYTLYSPNSCVIKKVSYTKKTASFITSIYCIDPIKNLKWM